VNFVSSLPATTVVLWHLRTSFSSCRCSSTKISSHNTTCKSICLFFVIRHVRKPS
jgi:hypothetical protein